MIDLTDKINVFIVIPARFASTRLPGKPLLNIGKQTMISRVTERAQSLAKLFSKNINVQNVHLVVATDHEEIFAEVQKLNATAVMTDSNLKNGTERVFSALKEIQKKLPIKNQDIVLNIQGDEPFFSLEDVYNLVEKMLNKQDIPLGTLAFRRTNSKMFFESSVVKVICDNKQNALYFSRAPIPYPKDILGATGLNWLEKAQNLQQEISFLHHVGVYSFRYQALCEYMTLVHSSLEQLESLEQLRALEAGWKILVCEALTEPFGIDTEDDLKQAQLIAQKFD
ncbi:3-deoxy-manno-octulosonate cytidylyltransferase [Fluviispira vulneris]|uniref:3-deoxy-manno-octulosonate cytidylyltransferase n=1 Tax=Fluviispira vulneris TaxID=2763012 RepID=UPI00164479B5|nr:3-deoxy-manno-octulosonate cytidylyltransferase [Fluviispira vulneris]